MTMTEHNPTSRMVVASRYEVDLDHPLGTGGMAMVYSGRDLRSKRPVALKTLRPEYQRDPESRRRFRQEARMMAFVSHPRLVTIYDLHEEPSGSWVVMELVPGSNLKQIVERDGPRTPRQIVPILEEIAAALGHLHDRNLVHLDIKPQNIIQMPDGHIKLIDFGLAQPAGPSQQLIGGTAFGTAAYLAPEQASGDPVDSSTDVYSLGCVVYELLTGRPPFIPSAGGDQKRELIDAHLNNLPVAPSEARPDLRIPSWVDDVIGWALAKRKSERFQDVATFAEMFRAGLEGAATRDPAATSVDPSATTRIQEARTIEEVPRRLTLSRRATSQGPTRWERAYAAGGRIARRTARFRGILWRLTLVLFIGNLLLGTVLLARGGPSALVERFLAVAPNTTTTVNIDELNLRVGPDLDSPVITVLDQGTHVRVTGLSQSDGTFLFWPVEVTIQGSTVSGWVWGEGLAPNEWTGRLGWVQGIVDHARDLNRQVNDWTDSIASLWPFTVDPVFLRHSFSTHLQGFVMNGQ